MDVLRKTSRCVSFEMFSIVPGFERPSFARRSEKEVTTSEMAVATGFSVRRAHGEPPFCSVAIVNSRGVMRFDEMTWDGRNEGLDTCKQ